MKSQVLLYHKVDHPTRDVKVRGAYTSPLKFERQMLYLLKKGFKFVTASEIASYFRDHHSFPKKTLALTFDDGWKDNYQFAYPILSRLGINATIFIVPDCIGRISDAVTAPGEAAREHMSAENIREMAAAGIEFGSHTMGHQLFTTISPEEIKTQVNDSKEFIEDLIQKPCLTLAYPAGYYTDEARRLVELAGYIAAFTTIYGSDEIPDLFALNRTEILRRHSRPFQFGRRVRSFDS